MSASLVRCHLPTAKVDHPALRPALGPRIGMAKYLCTNAACEATEKALRVRVELPDQVTMVQATPNAFDLAKTEVVFKPRTLAPGQQETYTITYEAKVAGRAYFRMRLEADALGDRPLLKEQTVEINNAR